MMSFCRSLAWASLTAVSTFHFRPLVRLIPASLTNGSALLRIVMDCRAFVVLYSSVTDLRGSWSLLLVLYRPTLLKLLGTPSHCLMCLLSVTSIFSISVMGMLYTVKGHDSLCKTPCWYIHSLKRPGKPLELIPFIQSAICV